MKKVPDGGHRGDSVRAAVSIVLPSAGAVYRLLALALAFLPTTRFFLFLYFCFGIRYRSSESVRVVSRFGGLWRLALLLVASASPTTRAPVAHSSCDAFFFLRRRSQGCPPPRTGPDPHRPNPPHLHPSPSPRPHVLAPALSPSGHAAAVAPGTPPPLAARCSLLWPIPSLADDSAASRPPSPVRRPHSLPRPFPLFPSCLPRTTTTLLSLALSLSLAPPPLLPSTQKAPTST